jgi:MSHA biogenesis protein MshJ
MKLGFAPLSRYLNTLSLRERLLLLGSLAAALAALADVLVLSPQAAAQKALRGRMQQQAAELQLLRQRVALPATETPVGQLARRVSEQQAQLAALDAAVADLMGGQAAGLQPVLQRLLRRHDRLSLVELRTQPPAAGDAAGRRSLELRVAGRYADLEAYLSAIERELPGLRWAGLDIDAGAQPPLLHARWWLPGES